MHCRILRQITLKADGHLGCDDSTGYKIDLGHVMDSPGWHLRDVLKGPVYQHVRSSFARNQVPWPGTCERCDLLSDGGRPVDTLDHRIDILVEPTLACTLACACCMRKGLLAKGRNTNSLEPRLLGRIVDSCKATGIEIDEVNYIGQGEPLMHGDFPALYAAVKRGAPEASQIINTTGNVDFRETVRDAEPDKVIVSCDGTSQASYERYRRGGNLRQALQFMKDCKQWGASGTFLEWKYILFEHNDSDVEIGEAQSLAEEFGVDALLFIITNSKWASKRFTVDNALDVPLRSSVARLAPSAAMNAIACESPSITRPPVADQVLGCIDVCTTTVGRTLNVEGWLLDATGRYVNDVSLWVDGVRVAQRRRPEHRSDVVKSYPRAEGPKCGFIFRVPIDPEALPGRLEVVGKGPSGSVTLGGPTHWIAPSNIAKRRTDMPSAPVTLGPRAPAEVPIAWVQMAGT